MACVNIINVNVLDNPCAFTNPFQFEVTFECLTKLDDDLEWRVVYVGTAENDTYDQELESVLVGPVPVGINKFVLQTAAPSPEKIPDGNLLGVTVVLITCSYKGREFVRIGYYVNNTLPGMSTTPEDESGAADEGDDVDMEDDDEDVDDSDKSEPTGSAAGGGAGAAAPEETVPPTAAAAATTKKSTIKVDDPSKVTRSILADKPRVTRFPIEWN